MNGLIVAFYILYQSGASTLTCLLSRGRFLKLDHSFCVHVSSPVEVKMMYVCTLHRCASTTANRGPQMYILSRTEDS